TTSGRRTWGAVHRPGNSLAPWPGGSSHPCARCGTVTAGIALGELCPRCLNGVTRKASRVGRLVAIVTTVLLAGYVILTLRSVGPGHAVLAGLERRTRLGRGPAGHRSGRRLAARGGTGAHVRAAACRRPERHGAGDGSAGQPSTIPADRRTLRVVGAR